MPTNQLINETSPYLKQHSHNPVNWFPWCKDAIEKAKRENKPILLSIGYTACHWCHVMAQESFENTETANLMNQYFINIKVDREERPDLDKIYQTANHLLTQGAGGWPLTVFLDPKDLTPFYSGTYFPPTPRFNLPSFKDVLVTIADIYQKLQHDIIKQNEQLRKVLNYEAQPADKIILNKQPLYLAHKKLESTYDSLYGGFGTAPKFFHTTCLEFLLQDSSSLVINTLMHMAQGGIFDQLGGGFFRYSTDVEWKIPHFEKMLYDNAQLLYLYTEAFHRYGQPYFGKVARKIATWVLNVMQSEEGCYYASLDADSEHQEGKYYLWSTSEIDTLLTQEEAKVIRIYYGLNNPPNFATKWHLYVAELLDVLTGQCKLSFNQVKQLLASGKKKLLTAREKRIPPQCDKKILTSWNALMIKSLFFAGDKMQEKIFIDSAVNALHFIQKNLWKNKRLFATYKDGQARFSGYLDDY
ncbi:MAG: thioredoxin domain-containing protein, partial [Gammaproteobacteria bacterium]|nr:thioredoxin domain-containing protein [Gammaproteobacteria bacterium]